MHEEATVTQLTLINDTVNVEAVGVEVDAVVGVQLLIGLRY